MNILSKKVLLLNQSYEPLTITSVKKVLKKILGGSTSFYVEEYYDDLCIKTDKSGDIKIPSVVRLSYFVKIKKAKSGIGKRKKIYMRDSYTCGYCGEPCGENLTLDHVIPKSKGGTSHYSNLLTSCRKCNNEKDDKLPEELGFKVPTALLHSNLDLSLLIRSANSNPKWKKYLFLE